MLDQCPDEAPAAAALELAFPSYGRRATGALLWGQEFPRTGMPLGVQRQITVGVVVLPASATKTRRLPQVGLAVRVHDEVDVGPHQTPLP